MTPSTLPDWNKIGRRIGKGLRDILHPPRDTGPTPQERKAQRLRDVLKGFAYYDTFDELISWSASDVDPLQQANTPLLQRSTNHIHDYTKPTTKLILCHDYKGGYHDHESVRPGPLSEEIYSCEYLQYVETFIYFSHKLVCCPPPSCTNVMHRNGVKVLGTFIVEPQTVGLDRMLERQAGEYVVATRLGALANTLGFDGWLLNIEKEFPRGIDVQVELSNFIAALKECLGPKRLVVWYDALTVENEVEYQNGLTKKNAAFARHADALFTNYKWTLERVNESREVVEELGMRSSDVYFGIDVWAQNTDMSGPPRVTYPAKRGGGTNTGLATRVLADEGFSAAVFGPAWTFEHFSTSSYPETSSPHGTHSFAKAVDRCMWEGFSLPKGLHCDCLQGHPHKTSHSGATPIVMSACQQPAGSSTYLHTDFIRAFKQDRGCLESTFGAQAVLPHLLPMPARDWEAMEGDGVQQVLYGQHDHGALSIRLRTARPAAEAKNSDAQAEASYNSSSLITSRLCLFKTDMACDGSLQAIITFLSLAVRRPCSVGLYTAYKIEVARDLEYGYHHIPLAKCIKSSDVAEQGPENTHTVQLRPRRAGSRLVEIGVFCQDTVRGKGSHELLHLTSLTVQPLHGKLPSFNIENIHTCQRMSGPHLHPRLAWTWSVGDAHWPRALPWSITTGPFAYFTVVIGGEEAGSAYATEFPVSMEDWRGCDDVQVSVMGHLFGGGSVSSTTVTLLRKDIWCSEDESWNIVSKMD